MSLFQCDKCGCLENTALTGAYWSKPLLDDHPEAIKSYMEVLGVTDFKLWGSYCSACNPIWYDEKGNYGIGPRPADYAKNPDKYKDDAGIWHGKFERLFLPKGLFHTNEDGNLAHLETLDTEVDKYALEAEEQIALHPYPRMDYRLPRPSDTQGCRRYLDILGALKKAPEHLQPKDEPTRRAAVMVLAYNALRAQRPEAEEDLPRRHRRLKVGGMTGLAAMAGLAAMSGMKDYREEAPRREPPPPRQPTPEELAADAERQNRKISAAEAKRKMRAEKRAKHMQSKEAT